MNTKKVSLSICIFSLILCFAFLLVGCGKTKEVSTTNITLNEAKTIIINALAIDEPSANDLSDEQNSGNRDLLSKFRRSKIKLEYGFYIDQSTYSQVTFDILAQKNLYDYEKFELTIFNYLGEIVTQEYNNDCQNVYQNSNGETEKITLELSNFYSLTKAGSNDGISVELVENLFTDESFQNLYETSATRTDFPNSEFSITLNIHLKEWLKIQFGYSDEEFDSLWNSLTENEKNTIGCDAQLAVNFKNSELQSIQLTADGTTIMDGEPLNFESKIAVEIYSQELSEPQWVSDYLDSLNNPTTSQTDKSIILDELNNQGILEYFGKTQFSADNISVLIEYKDNSATKYCITDLLNTENVLYWDGENLYRKASDSITIDNDLAAAQNNYFQEYNNITQNIKDLSIENFERVNVEDGYSIIVDNSAYVPNMQITFVLDAENNITQLQLTINNVTTTLFKYNDEITEPQWLTDYKNSL